MLKENTCFLGLTAGTCLQTSTEHTGLLKTLYTDNKDLHF